MAAQLEVEITFESIGKHERIKKIAPIPDIRNLYSQILFTVAAVKCADQTAV
jgi:hypothetical protein